ncbi:hypothetical protein OG389_00490 [Streptomyces sp. NBC_00435]|uniref:hypothetical protein n=1 Tax=Streptomyces sp. NBC_00435 TaxID=2903649 RepID=UPI002E22CB34
MEHAPIVVHRIAASGGRRVAIRVSGIETVLGVAYADVIEFLRRTEVPDPDDLVLGDSTLIEWQGDGRHVYDSWI